jgi:hypothetical protein
LVIIRRPLASFRIKEISEHIRNLAHFLVKAKPLASRGGKIGRKILRPCPRQGHPLTLIILWDVNGCMQNARSLI